MSARPSRSTSRPTSRPASKRLWLTARNTQAGLKAARLFVPEEEIRERTFAMARHCGLLAGVRYAEPFVQKEIGLIDDLMLLAVASI